VVERLSAFSRREPARRGERRCDVAEAKRGDARPVVLGVALVAVALAVGWALGGDAGFGIALGLVGTAGTILAAVDARRSAGQTEEVAERARDAAEQVRMLADDLGHASKTDRVLRVKGQVQRIGAVVSPPAADPVTDSDLLQLAGALADALWRAGRLVLPDCWALVMALVEVSKTLQSPFYDDPPTKASAEQLAALTKSMEAAFAEVDRNADLIPVGKPPA
jgi:hypothetical protein